MTGKKMHQNGGGERGGSGLTCHGRSVEPFCAGTRRTKAEGEFKESSKAHAEEPAWMQEPILSKADSETGEMCKRKKKRRNCMRRCKCLLGKRERRDASA